MTSDAPSGLSYITEKSKNPLVETLEVVILEAMDQYTYFVLFFLYTVLFLSSFCLWFFLFVFFLTKKLFFLVLIFLIGNDGPPYSCLESTIMA